MTLKTDMAADLLNVFYDTGEFAMSVTYSPVEGFPTAITVIMSHGTLGREDIVNHAPGSDELAVEAEFRLRVSEVGTVTPGDLILFTRSGENFQDEWEVMGDAEKTADGLEWIVSAARRDPKETDVRYTA